jgi:PAS domain S-box-containing protein
MTADRNSTRAGLTLIQTAALLGCVAVSIPPSVAHAQQTAVPKRVLVLHWYNKDHPWNVRFDEGFQSTLKSAPGTVEYYSEYLESNRFPGEAQSLLLRDYLRQKYADRTIDVVVANSDASLDFLLKYRAGLFPESPIVFVAVRHPTTEELAAGPGLTGIINVNAYRKTLDLALRLHPGTKQVFVISGTIQRDKRFETLAREDLWGHESGALFTFLTDLSPDELIAQMKRLPEQSIVLYVWQQSRNEQGEVLESLDILAWIAQSARVPIYELSHEFPGRGVVGGYIATAGAQGTKVAEIALRIANGARAQDIPVENGPTIPIFDWRELQRWGISEDKLPPDRIVRFKDVTFWEHYKWHIVGVLSLCIVQALLILALLAQRVQRRRVEETLRENQERLARTEDFSLVMATHVGLDGRWLRVPPTLCKLLGYTEEELLAGYFKDVTHPDDFEADWSQCQRLIRGEIKSFDLEKRYIHKDGHIIWAYLNCSIVTDAKGKPIHFLTYIRDIARRKEVEEALRESEERYRAIVEAQTELICKLLPDGTLTFVNEPYASYFGHTPEELVNTSFRPFIPTQEEEHISEFMGSFSPSNPVATIEHRVLLPSGERRWHQWTDRAIYDDQGRLLEFQCVGRDITRRKLAEEALRRSEEALRESHARIEDLAGRLIIAQEEERKYLARELHDDLNQQIAALATGLGNLERQLVGADGTVRGQITKLEDRVGQLSERIRQLSHELHSSTLEHVGLAEALRAYCSEFAAQEGIAVDLEIRDSLGALSADAALCLYRVAQESLRNIARHSGAKSAEVTLASAGDLLELRVSDRGRGFDLKEAGRQSGLGLVSMEERVKLLHGSFEVRSRPGSGTELAVHLPLITSSGSGASHRSKSAAG